MSSSADLHKRHPPARLQVIGQELYKQKKYSEAIDALTASIKANHGKPSIPLLALRAAAYEKLGKIKEALKDGREMIEVAAEDVQGYLVTGRLLKQMKNDVLAVKIYQRGQRLCKAQADRDKILSRIRELDGGVTNHAVVDPLQILPLELIEMVFAHLSFKTLCLTTKVNKHWRESVKSLPSLWTVIDTTMATKPVRNSDLLLWVDNAQRRLITVKLKNVQLQQNKVLATITKKSPILQNLSLLSGGELSGSLLHALTKASHLQILRLCGNIVLTDHTAAKVAKACPNLIELCFGYLRIAGSPASSYLWSEAPVHDNLQVLEFLSLETFNFLLNYIVRPGTKLKRLTIKHKKQEGYGGVPSQYLNAPAALESLVLSQCHLPEEQLIGVSHSVRALQLLDCYVNPSINDRNLGARQQASEFFPNLRELDTGSGSDLNGTLTNMILQVGSDQHPKGLRRLRVAQDLASIEKIVEIMHNPRISTVRQLELINARELTDACLDQLLINASQLEEVAIPGSQVTGVGVKALVTGLCNLRKIDLTDCVRVGADAVDWARKQGIQVKYLLH